MSSKKDDKKQLQTEEPEIGSQQTLLDIHRALMYGEKFSTKYLNWSGTVRLNKSVRLSISDAEGRQHHITLEGDRPESIGLMVLQQLILKQ